MAKVEWQTEVQGFRGSGVLGFWGSEVKRRQRRHRRPECATENRSEHLITCGSRGRSQVIALKSTARDVCKANHRNFIYDAAILWLRLCHTCLRRSEVPVFVRWVMGDGRWVVAGKMDEKRHVAHVSWDKAKAAGHTHVLRPGKRLFLRFLAFPGSLAWFSGGSSRKPFYFSSTNQSLTQLWVLPNTHYMLNIFEPRSCVPSRDVEWSPLVKDMEI